MKKKNIALALSLLMIAGSMVACGKKKGGDKSSSEEKPTVSSVSEATTSEVATSEVHEHAFGDWTTTKAATHMEEGEETRTCACGETETRTVAKTTEHTFGDWTTTKAATHMEEGEEARTCACGETETRPVGKLADHAYGEWTVKTPATHTSAGLEERVCPCGSKETRPIAKTSEHEFGGWTTVKEATCTEAGTEERVCPCGEKETRPGSPATGHDLYSDWRMDETNHWRACKYDPTEQVGKEAHNYNQNLIKDEYLVSGPLPFHGSTYHTSCICGKAGTSTFNNTDYAQVTSYTWVKEPTVDDFGIIKCSYENFDDYVFQIPELGNTAFWDAGEEVEIPGGKSKTYTYKTSTIGLKNTADWTQANYDSDITPFARLMLTNLLRYAGTPNGSFGTIGLSYTMTAMNPTFSNGYCAQTGEETFRFYIEDVFSVEGKGTAVTGKVEGASVSVGDKVTFYKIGSTDTVEYTVSRLERFNQTITTAEPGTSVGMFFEENPERSTFSRGSLIADPEGNWTPTTSLTGTLYLLEVRHTPIQNNYRSNLFINNIDVTAQYSFDGDLIMPGANSANVTATLATSVYVFNQGEFVMRETATIGYFVYGGAEENCGTYVNRVSVMAKSTLTSTPTKTVVSQEHFVDEEGNQFKDPMMLEPTEVTSYELYVGVSGYGTIAGRGTYLSCKANEIYDTHEDLWTKENTNYVTNTAYIGKQAVVEYVDGEGHGASKDVIITGCEKLADGSYTFLCRGLESDVAEKSLRLYIVA